MYRSHVSVIGQGLWSQLCDLAPVHVRPARSVLLRQGDPGTHVVLLAAGSALVTLTGFQGEQSLLAVRGAGEIFGELAVLDDHPRTASVTAAEVCRVHIVPAPVFLTFVDRHGLLGPLLRHAIARVREAETALLEMATAPVPVRLASALGRLLPTASATDTEYVVPLTQAELSRMIGASRNAVGSALRPWRLRGWLDTEATGGLLVRDIAAIRSHAYAQQ
ncbi:Crp/Fnr family transcriptional regulator [Streptomyces maremycinicus]|uniref:Crp/Fnr family transcriptional regulator n=1 Tax=Streptomyces maremycinicus TaxID=1679753 RepID=UPI000787D366|nr:Crp/Fnr family transcriptional regulator [Streptomyces sp. NBRC 110468]